MSEFNTETPQPGGPFGAPFDEPFAWFEAWFADAQATDLSDPNAMTLATVSPGGQPTARVVLLKEWDAQGFVFYTNFNSQKGQDLLHHPRAGLNFFWRPLGRQVRIEGLVMPVEEARADAYFATRDRAKQLGAWASQQSQPLASRDELEARLAQFEEAYAGQDVPRPPHWSGLCVTPLRMEFWQAHPARWHDRWAFRRATPNAPWSFARLNP